MGHHGREHDHQGARDLVTDRCGLKVLVTRPEQSAQDLPRPLSELVLIPHCKSNWDAVPSNMHLSSFGTLKAKKWLGYIVLRSSEVNRAEQRQIAAIRSILDRSR
ncbi:MAG: hypothetical protein U0892_12485 [Pirellulales bacterium]